jgi:hypothetical protein
VTPAQWDRAEAAARRRRSHHALRRTKGTYGLTEAREAALLDLDTQGCLAELLTATGLGVEDAWVDYTEDFQSLSGDVAPGVQVRSTHYIDTGRLILHDRDDDDSIFVLVGIPKRTRARPYPDSAVIIGWILGWDGKRDRFFKEVNGNGRPAYFVPRERLLPGLPPVTVSIH